MLITILAEGAKPTALYLDATGWVAVGMLIVFGIMIWAKVPKLVGGMLDKQIAEIKKTLDEAADLRKEAEALKAEYEAKTAGAQAEAEALMASAEKEAEALVAQATVDTKALVARRKKMAEEKIAAAERSAIAAVRAKAATAATQAAEALISAKHDASADKSLVDKAIGDIGKTVN
ncbi:F-type H+-transporting ATPase subunit b [Parasphingorhabdus marina DSM 22363]|uniref:ATP synthase subunit b n=1 Tax=Parasphingorhabdus marina DSM 22363 TaxID=1123272 RepID=A0A1N6G5S0_9SPHN|nr:F0F1 ATP synthase subunit B [Parasphingorhabdus marina]SIO02899.1 F-type H+-transporting ATPase subunit b [Parasphingorhabdus marina DSM 22363]